MDSPAVPIVKCAFLTLSIALTTGNSGNVFATAFDKRNQMQLVTALPHPITWGSATELISLIGTPALSNVHLFPIRCGANINTQADSQLACIYPSAPQPVLVDAGGV